jgi:integrase
MNMNQKFSSILAPALDRYLSLKQSLGRKYRRELSVLANLDGFLSSTCQDLTSKAFQQWISPRSDLASGVKRDYMRIVRSFCLYRRRTEAGCFVPDPHEFPIPHQTVRPYIFQQSEIAHLLAETRHLRPAVRSPLHRQNMYLGVILLYTTGLRRGELLRLTLGDCDLSEGTLRIQESKFHKSRLLPLSRDALHALKMFLRERQVSPLPLASDSPLLWNGYGSGMYSGTGFAMSIQALFRKCNIRTATGRLPRIHDFRHSFAIQALLRWYHEGRDVQTRLPALSTYMGHVSVASTEYYLPFVEQLAAVASERFRRRCGAFVRLPGHEVRQGDPS